MPCVENIGNASEKKKKTVLKIPVKPRLNYSVLSEIYILVKPV